MKKFLIIPAIALLALTGCTKKENKPESESVDPGTSIDVSDPEKQAEMLNLLAEGISDSALGLSGGIKLSSEAYIDNLVANVVVPGEEEEEPDTSVALDVKNLGAEGALTAKLDNGLTADFNVQLGGSVDLTLNEQNLKVLTGANPIKAKGYVANDSVYLDLSDRSLLNFVTANIENILDFAGVQIPLSEPTESEEAMTLPEFITTMYESLGLDKCFMTLGMGLDTLTLPEGLEEELKDAFAEALPYVAMFKDFVDYREYQNGEKSIALEITKEKVLALIASLEAEIPEGQSYDGYEQAKTILGYFEKANGNLELRFDKETRIAGLSSSIAIKGAANIEGTVNASAELAAHRALTLQYGVAPVLPENFEGYTDISSILSLLGGLGD